MSTQSGCNLDIVDPASSSLESTLRSPVYIRRRKKFLASPLLHLPTELILEIFVYAIDLDGGPSFFVLTAICHRLRKVPPGYGAPSISLLPPLLNCSSNDANTTRMFSLLRNPNIPPPRAPPLYEWCTTQPRTQDGEPCRRSWRVTYSTTFALLCSGAHRMPSLIR